MQGLYPNWVSSASPNFSYLCLALVPSFLEKLPVNVMHIRAGEFLRVSGKRANLHIHTEIINSENLRRHQGPLFWLSLLIDTFSVISSSVKSPAEPSMLILRGYQRTNISHHGNRNIIFKMPFLGDMLVPWRIEVLVQETCDIDASVQYLIYKPVDASRKILAWCFV